MKRENTITHAVEIGLRFLGLWPDSTYPTLYWMSYMTTIVIMEYCQYSYVFTYVELNNFSLLMDRLTITMGHTHAFIKYLILWRNRRIFHCILRSTDRDWRECAVSHTYLSAMLGVANVSRRCSNILIGINILTAFFVSIGGYIFQRITNAAQDDNEPRQLALRMKIPFDVSASPIFECFLIGRFIYELSIAFTIAVVNALLVALILHISGQIDIMRHDLNKISNSKYDRSTSLTTIKNLIYRHQNMIILSENVERLFCYISLMQILWNTWIICCTTVMIILAIDAGKDMTVMLKSVIYYIAIIVEVFMFCFAGEYLSTKSKSICDSVYESLWYDMPSSDSRILLLVMIRSQKRLTITAGKIIDLTLESFTSLMKASASYASVLNAMH